MSLPVSDRDEMLGAVSDATERWCNLIRAVDDPSATAIGHWDIQTLAAHVSHVFTSLASCARGESSPVTDHRAISAGWQAHLDQDPERDLDRLARRAEEGLEEFVSRAAGQTWTELRPWHGGLQIPMYGLASILLNETQIHGRDVAGATNNDWAIPTRHAALAIEGHLTFLPAFVNEGAAAGLEATYELSLRQGPKIYLHFDDAALTIDQERPDSVDCHVNADPVTYLLVGYGRVSQWRAIATGKVLAWGRKPWLGLRFGELFVPV